MVGAGVIAVEEADFVTGASGVEGPGIAFELVVGVEADSGEEHLSPLETGEGTVGIEAGIGDAVDNALLFAEGDVAGSPVISGDVLEGGVGSDEGVGGFLTKDHVGNDFGSLVTLVGALGSDFGVGHTVDDTEAGKDTDGLEVGVANLVGILEFVDGVISGGADDSEAENHDERQHEGQ